MATTAYLRLLDKARCTVNFCVPNPFMGKKALTIEEQIDFIMSRLAKFKVRGYSREYVAQLVIEDNSQH